MKYNITYIYVCLKPVVGVLDGVFLNRTKLNDDEYIYVYVCRIR